MGKTKNEVMTKEVVIENAKLELVHTTESITTELSKGIDFQSEVIVRGKDNMKLFRNYKFKNPVGARTSFEISDEKAIDSIDRITAVNTITERGDLLVCYELSELANSEIFKDTDLDIKKFASGMWGIDGKTVTQYIRIGSLFVNREESGYKLINSVPSTLKKSQLLEFLAYIGKEYTQLVQDENGDTHEETKDFTLDTIEDLYATGVLKDGMTSKGIRKALKEFTGKAIEKSSGTKSDGEAFKKDMNKLPAGEKVEYARSAIVELEKVLDALTIDGFIKDDIAENVSNSISYIRSIVENISLEVE